MKIPRGCRFSFVPEHMHVPSTALRSGLDQRKDFDGLCRTPF
jgi:hypothetical protein